MLFALVAWPLQRYRPERFALASVRWNSWRRRRARRATESRRRRRRKPRAMSSKTPAMANTAARGIAVQVPRAGGNLRTRVGGTGHPRRHRPASEDAALRERLRARSPPPAPGVRRARRRHAPRAGGGPRPCSRPTPAPCPRSPPRSARTCPRATVASRASFWPAPKVLGGAARWAQQRAGQQPREIEARSAEGMSARGAAAMIHRNILRQPQALVGGVAARAAAPSSSRCRSWSNARWRCRTASGCR